MSSDGTAAFASALEQAWRNDRLEDVFARVRTLFAPDFVQTQPVLPAAVGLAEFERAFRGLSRLMPDFEARVVGWAATDGLAYVEFRLTGTVGRRPIVLRVCDRIVVLDGVGVERHSFLDPYPLLLAVARQPRVWPRAARSGIGYLRAGRRRT